MLASPLDDLRWKRFCLLPTVLFIDIGKHRRADLDCKINLILADTWPFQVGDFPGRMTKPKPVKISSTPSRGQRPVAVPVVIGSDFDPDKRRLDYFKKLMSKGEVSKAYRAIVSDAKVLPYSPEGLTFLQSKHPSPKPGSPPWTSVMPDQMEEEPFLISFESVVKLIRSSSKKTSCGVDNFPIDILKQLSKTVVKKEFPVEMRTFLELLTACSPLVTALQGSYTFMMPVSRFACFKVRLRSDLSERRPLTAKLSMLPSCYHIEWNCKRNSGMFSSVGHLSGLSECRMRSTCISVSTPIYSTVHLTTPMLTAIRNGGQFSPG